MKKVGSSVEDIARNWSAGRISAALQQILTIEPSSLANADTAATLGSMCSSSGELGLAQAFYERASTLAPRRQDIGKLYAGALMAAGRFTEADALLKEVIARDPTDADAWYARAQAGRQSSERDLIGPITRLLDSDRTRPSASVFLHYALGKCYDDIEDYESALYSYRAGASLRRSQLEYDAGLDRRVVRQIREQLSYGPDDADLDAKFRPVFVVGLPRSGTTLLERILGSHSQVTAIGESSAFTQGLTRQLAIEYPDRKLSRPDAVSLSKSIQHEAVGEFYINALPPRAAQSIRVVDKMPLNFLYVSLIRRALPGSKILIMRRQPMANCWSMFATLFRKAYPFSYDIVELAKYYSTFVDLTDALLAGFSNTVSRVNYEDLVMRPSAEVRRILHFLDLPWEEQCLAFHKSSVPTATASLEQVRRPLYRTSIDRWKNYPGKLEDLACALRKEGMHDA